MCSCCWQHRGRVERFRRRAVLVQEERWVSRDYDHSCPALVGMETVVFSIWSSDFLLPECPNLQKKTLPPGRNCGIQESYSPLSCLPSAPWSRTVGRQLMEKRGGLATVPGNRCLWSSLHPCRQYLEAKKRTRHHYFQKQLRGGDQRQHQ